MVHVLIKGNLEVKLPTKSTHEKQRLEESEKKVKRENQRREEKKIKEEEVRRKQIKAEEVRKRRYTCAKR